MVFWEGANAFEQSGEDIWNATGGQTASRGTELVEVEEDGIKLN